jgi:hypothetical protein
VVTSFTSKPIPSLALIALAFALGACAGAQDTPAAQPDDGSGGAAAGGSGGPGSGGAVASGTGGHADSGGSGGGDRGGSGGESAGSGGGENAGGSGGAGMTIPPDAATGLDADTTVPDAGTGSGGTSGAKTAAIVWGYGEHQPTPKPTATPMLLDRTMKARLEARGYTVDMLEDAVSTVAAVTGKSLLVISSSINRTNLFDGKKARFMDVAVPTIVMKDGTIEVMGLGTGSAGGFSTGVGETQITIVAPGDPLAAGLMGNVAVYTKGDRLIFANPGPAAKKIATVVGNATQVTIFAYAAGATMVNGVVAPAKRMGFFIHRNTDYNANGLKLFDAAVDYLVAP